jgi:hypothetical protein
MATARVGGDNFMLRKRSLIGVWVTLACLVLGLGGARVVADGVHIDPDLMRTSVPLTSDQQATIDSAIGDAINAAAKASPADIAEICSSLRDPLRQGGSSIFNRAYLSALERKLTAALTANPPLPPLVRFNLMSVVTDLISDDPAPTVIMPLIHSGLTDTGPGAGATIYWAARAAATLAPATPLTAADEQALLTDLAAAAATIEKETPLGANWPALGAINQALARLSAPAAATQRLAGIERRFPLYIANPGLSVAPEREGLVALYVRKYTVTAPPNDVIVHVAAITFRYLDLAGKLCDTDPENQYVAASAAARPELRRMIEAASSILSWAWDTLNVGTKMTPMPNPLPEQKDWVMVREVIRQWGKALAAAPFSIPDADLWAPVHKKAESPAD